MKTHFILVEDDPQQSETIQSALKRRYRDAEVELVETESEFYERMDAIPTLGERPHMVICDVMLPWAFASNDATPPPPDVAAGTFRRAGMRCWERFRKRPDLCSVPWIYFTVLDEKTIDLKSHSDARTGYVQKAGSIEPLYAEIEEFQDGDWLETPDGVSKKLMALPRMRRILLDGLNAPLDSCANSLP